VIEIRFHGRGGQGAVVASELLAQAAFRDGKQPQSFPFFGVERRGAPVTAFARIDREPIRLRTSITEPDIVVVLDPGLMQDPAVTEGLATRGLLLVNTHLPPEELAAPPTVRRATVDANRIALDHGLGTPTMPIVNTTVLGALARVSGIVSLEALDAAIEAHVPARFEENCRAAVEGFARVLSAPPTPRPPASPSAPRPPRSIEPLPEAPFASASSERRSTSTWRTLRPVIHRERCTRCNFCWKYCPDDALAFDPAGFPVLRAEYCKGCGICATECPPRTIDMVAEA
jgi:pyruvate ferredoxin oxidoreductase gamma subunit